MKLRRHIAFLAVLVASTVMFAHVVVPHHHCSEDFSVCSPVLGIQHVSGGHAPEPEGASDGCDLAHSIPSLLFIPRDNGGNHLQTDVGPLLSPIFLCADRTDTRLPVPASSVSTCFGPPDIRLNSLWTPGTVSGRAPPFVL